MTIIFFAVKIFLYRFFLFQHVTENHLLQSKIPVIEMMVNKLAELTMEGVSVTIVTMAFTTTSAVC